MKYQIGLCVLLTVLIVVHSLPHFIEGRNVGKYHGTVTLLCVCVFFLFILKQLDMIHTSFRHKKQFNCTISTREWQ